jgi:hypothetical protein
MNSRTHSHDTKRVPRTGVRKLLSLLLGFAILALVLLWQGKGLTPALPSGESAEVAPTDENASSEPKVVSQTGPIETTTTINAAMPIREPEERSAASAQSTPHTRQLVDKLCQPTLGNAEQTAAWKRDLQELVAQGQSAVPAIREFLQKNQEVDFTGAIGLGYASARAAMFDALLQIGGPEATAVMLETLRTTAEPREIAMLGRNLDSLEPELHRQAAFEAARHSLAMAGEGKLVGIDVAPLFDLFRQLGNAEVVADLEQASTRWGYYGTMALAQLADGLGVPSLVRMSKNESSGGLRLNSMEMLVQLAAQYPDARAAVLEQARLSQIPQSTWAHLTPFLAGDYYRLLDSIFDTTTPQFGKDLKTVHIRGSNQNLLLVPRPGITAPDQIQRQIELVNELSGVVSNPAAIQALQQARTILAQRSALTIEVPR